MTAIGRDARDRQTDLVQALVDEAFADGAKRPKIASLLFGDQLVGAPPGNWPPPTPDQIERAHIESRDAASAARGHLRISGITRLYAAIKEAPRPRVIWSPLRPELVLPPAPLLYSLIEDDAWRVLVTLTAYAHSRHTKLLFDQDIRHSQLRRLNAFAQLEITLWWFAEAGGHTEPPPYAVRYDLARWLWHPSIPGAIFCLRCGRELHYARAQRILVSDPAAESSRTARCRACSRGPANEWPEHAVEPYQRGTWLLRCAAPECDRLFVGRRQARHCEQHRLNQITASRRR